MILKKELIKNELFIYTDGSCHAQKRTGTWVAIILHGVEKIILQGSEVNTTHNRMELMAVIKGVEYAGNNMDAGIVMHVVTDSQYVVGLPERRAKLEADNFITKQGKDLQNSDLLKILFYLFSNHTVQLSKIRAHQKHNGTINYNIEADKLSRGMMRQLIN
ncbi:MAG: RNase H family protein [Ferruginibacter sp.]